MQVNERNGIILVLGGARSGKSSFAEALARELGGPVTYIATAEARDPEMADRIARHQAARPAHWKTIEAPLNLAEAIRASSGASVILVDCVTLYLSNLLMQELGMIGESENPKVPPGLEEKIMQEVQTIIQAATESAALVIFVSNEVGLGLVPPYNLGRFYRDLAGRVNRELAAVAGKVYLLNTGIAIELKALALSPKQAAAGIRAAQDAGNDF
jgi:adenosylcobinamide kinase/adenosylcobinamide-phosphate guanylyltransferase